MRSHIRADLMCKVSFHGGRKYNLTHNHRTFDPTKWNIQDNHIDYSRSGLNEILISKNLKEFFDEEFGDALVASDKANERKHPDRVWGISRQEYEKIKKEEGQERADEVRRESALKNYFNAKHCEVQEFIIQIGDHETYLKMVEQYGQKEADEFYRAFLTEALEDFQKQNPQLVVFDASIHFDEVVEGSPHIHIDTLPIAEYSKGMTKKVSLEGALKMQGYDRKQSHTYADTPYKNFLRTHRAHLEELGRSYATIIPSEHTGKQHTPTHVHRNQQLIKQNKEAEEQLAKTQEQNDYLSKENAYIKQDTEDYVRSLSPEPTKTVKKFLGKGEKPIAKTPEEIQRDTEVKAAQAVLRDKDKVTQKLAELETYEQGFTKYVADREKEYVEKEKQMREDFQHQLNAKTAEIEMREQQLAQRETALAEKTQALDEEKALIELYQKIENGHQRALQMPINKQAIDAMSIDTINFMLRKEQENGINKQDKGNVHRDKSFDFGRE